MDVPDGVNAQLGYFLNELTGQLMSFNKIHDEALSESTCQLKKVNALLPGMNFSLDEVLMIISSDPKYSINCCALEYTGIKRSNTTNRPETNFLSFVILTI